jgi:transcriptional regulator with XRE-family HTH domain
MAYTSTHDSIASRVRCALRLTQSEMGYAIDRSYPTVRQYESGKIKTPVEVLRRFYKLCLKENLGDLAKELDAAICDSLATAEPRSLRLAHALLDRILRSGQRDRIEAVFRMLEREQERIHADSDNKSKFPKHQKAVPQPQSTDGSQPT